MDRDDSPIDYRARRSLIQDRLKRRHIDAVLISQPENRRYLSGYSAIDHGIGESSGMLYLPARGEATLLTDSRFQLQAEQETDLSVIIYKKGVLALLDTLLRRSDCRRLAFESHYTLHSLALKLSELAEKRGISLIPVQTLVEKERLCKSARERALLKRSTALNEQIFNNIFATLVVGMTEIEVALAIESAMRQAGAEGPSFPTIVAAGANSARPHAVPTSHPIGPGEPVTIDMGLILDGYCSDMTRSFVLGDVDSTYRTIHRTVRAAQLAGTAAIRPGVPMAEADRAARQVIEDAGYGQYFGHALGHGVGLAVHEAPRLSPRSRQKLQAGMVVSVEPGIYLPGWGGVRLENLVVVQEDGAEVLNEDRTWLDL